MGWLIALCVLILTAAIPLGISARYNSAGACIRLTVAGAKITLYPKSKKEKKEKKSQKSEKKKAPQNPPPPPKAAEEKQPAEKGGSLTDFLPFVRLGLDFLGDFRRKLRLDVLEMKLILGGTDPAKLAVSYGRAWAALGNLMPQLDRLFVIKKRDLEVECDFTAPQTLVIARLDVTVTVGRLLSLAVGYGIRALKEYLKFRNKRKGGAKQ